MFSAKNEVSASGRGIVLGSTSNNEEYRIVLPRLPSGNLVLNSVFLHGDLAGGQFRAPDFRGALHISVNQMNIVGIEQYHMSQVWMVTCANAAVKEKLVAQVEPREKGRKCLIVDHDSKEIKLKLLLLSYRMENRRVAETLAPFGVVHSITRDKWRCSGMNHIETVNREIQLTLHDDAFSSNIPHLLTVFGCQSLVLVPGRPPICLLCNCVGHVRQQCRTPRCPGCRRYGHCAENSVTMYATKLQAP